ncbi:hypothetical protein ACFCZT_09315 [Streptomyces sp. NPDC056230]|uniref:hypothetical protein n=1 Tax=Streptomyces sp. NPDC056230 TaxID=3345754 RepID=UPI0035DF9D80
MATPQDVVDAWADITTWVQDTLPELAQQQSLPVGTYDAGDLGACSAFNDPGGGSVGWGSDGDATITLTALKIASMSGVKIQTAEAVDGTTVHLPLSFSQLGISGNYSYGQPCAYYDLGKKADSATASGHGSIAQTISNNSLYYVAKLGDTVTLNTVVVNGAPTVTVTPDTGGMPSWLVAIGNFFSTFKEEDALRSTLQNVFLTADFSKTLIALLNQRIGGRT